MQSSGHELLLEIIPPTELPRAADTVCRAIERLYNLDIFPEWWKLEPMAAAEWAAIDALIEERDPYCRGVLLLGQAADADALAAGFAEARVEPDLPRLRRRPHDLSRAQPQVAGR